MQTLKNNIMIEYGLVVLTFIFLLFVAPLFFTSRINASPKGLDNIGNALAYLIIYNALTLVFPILFLVGNPFRILLQFHRELEMIVSIRKRVLTIILILAPILTSIPFLFRVPLENLIYHLKYEVGRHAYTVKEEDYQSPQAFRDTLIERGLYFTEEDMAVFSAFNAPFGSLENQEQYYYMKGSMMGLATDYYYDTLQSFDSLNAFLDPDTATEKYPLYIYNATVAIPRGEETLRYFPFARFGQQSYGPRPANQYPFYTDYYLECKIFDVDGQIYALIGIGASYAAEKSFDDFTSRPYAIIIAEKSTITTYFKEKYYPDGSISVDKNHYNMKPNKEEPYGSFYDPPLYPVKVVDKLNRESIDAVLRELQEEALKESVEKYFIDLKEKQ